MLPSDPTLGEPQGPVLTVKWTNLTRVHCSVLQVKSAVFLAYMRAVGALLSCVIVLFYILYNAASIYSNVWLSEWSNDARFPNSTHDPDQRNMRLGVYGALGVLQGKRCCLSFFVILFLVLCICLLVSTVCGYRFLCFINRWRRKRKDKLLA